MKTFSIFAAILALSLSACAQKPAESKAEAKTEAKAEVKAEMKAEPNIAAKLDTTVPWLQVKIWDYQSRQAVNPPRKIIKTTFEGKPVYYVPPVCCNIPSELYAEDGTLICYPSGGFTGAGDGKCPKFKLEYVDLVKDNKTSIIWEDKRKPAVDAKSTRVVPDLK
jgi:ABC-type amino acid transport substrate-binding protein